ncbi:carbohydrate ABC transporter permease [Vallitalea okinawensis]|uniref:carbohydrate ABC transporter permease n=1 Tax=Vallitalea okinawensis TaxID=2078660 RepID=UPI000CFA8B11|nr:carbohydrate ABC transporter permease [Vallitalea okinawensis]
MKGKKSIIKGLIIKALIFVFITAIIIISLGPLLWVFVSSFKTNREILSGGLGLPSVFSFKNYIDALTIAPIPQFYFNSIIVSIVATVGNVFLLSMAAYTIARFDWKYNGFFTMMFSVGLLIPGAALLQPLYQTMTTAHLNDSLTGLIIIYMAFGLPSTIYIMRSYFKTIPREMEESAYMDGSGFFRTFVSIILPIAKPALGTAAILEFLLCWNEFQFALSLTSSNSKRTLPIALYYFKSQFASNYGAMFAATIMVVVPSIFVYIALQEQVVSGLAAGAVKG